MLTLTMQRTCSPGFPPVLSIPSSAHTSLTCIRIGSRVEIREWRHDSGSYTSRMLQTLRRSAPFSSKSFTTHFSTSRSSTRRIALLAFDIDALQVNSPELFHPILVRPLRCHRAFRRASSRDPSRRGQFAHMPAHRSRLRGGKEEFANVGRRRGVLSGRCQRRNAPPVRCRRTTAWASATDGSHSKHAARIGRMMRCGPRESPHQPQRDRDLSTLQQMKVRFALHSR